ncbi:hypothetical protein MUP29_10245 [bacterium]|nr:hypothetical protein [bacterium]
MKKLFKGEHPFLTEPGFWIVAGHGMSGEPLDRVPIQGRIQISHEVGQDTQKILNIGEMSVVSRSNPLTFQTSYEMIPSEDALQLDFFQANETVGDLKGKVVFFDDRLISTYTSGDGSLTGYEVLHRMGENRYAVTGTLLGAGKLVNLWKLDLVRPSENGPQEIDEHSSEA